MDKKILVTASFFGALAVILGAYAAHGLEKLIDADSVATFKTGVQYQMYHVFLLLFLGVTDKISQKTKTIIFYLVLIGIVCFSGSIYGLSTNELSGFDFKKIALVTPLGGLFFIASWLVLGISFIRKK